MRFGPFAALLAATLLQICQSGQNEHFLDRSRFRSMWSRGAPVTHRVGAKHCKSRPSLPSRDLGDAREVEDRLRRRVLEVTRQADGSIIGDYGPFFLRKRTRFDHRLRCTACDAQALWCSPTTNASGARTPTPSTQTHRRAWLLQTKAEKALEQIRASYKIGLGKHLLADDRAIESLCNVRRLIGKPTLRWTPHGHLPPFASHGPSTDPDPSQVHKRHQLKSVP